MSLFSRDSTGAWGIPNRPRNQDLPPVIPNPTLSGAWDTPSHPPGSSGANGRIPGSRNHNLPPVIPNPTLGTPSRPPGSFGVTPGSGNQDLPPVMPNSTLGGAWGTPNRSPNHGAGSFGDLSSGGGGNSGLDHLINPTFSIYGPQTNGGRSTSPFLASRSVSPYPNDGVEEDVDERQSRHVMRRVSDIEISAGA